VGCRDGDDPRIGGGGIGLPAGLGFGDRGSAAGFGNGVPQ